MTVKQPSAHDYATTLAHLGIDLSRLGCVMANVAPIPILDLLLADGTLTEDDFERDLVSMRGHRPDLFWVDGAVVERSAHVTLLYGLVGSPHEWRPQVDALLDGLDLTSTLLHTDVFASPYPDEPYDCVVAKLASPKPGTGVWAANERLRYLPHVDTFPHYQPHVTLAYVKAGRGSVWASALARFLPDYRFEVTGIDYGNPPDDPRAPIVWAPRDPADRPKPPVTVESLARATVDLLESLSGSEYQPEPFAERRIAAARVYVDLANALALGGDR